MVRLVVVAPLMVEPFLMVPFFTKFVPFTHHWYFNGTVPMAVTVKDAVAPTAFVWPIGCTKITGDDSTVRLATELVTDPP